jgi:hypothetical protein
LSLRRRSNTNKLNAAASFTRDLRGGG